MNKENTKTYLSASLTQQNTKAIKAPRQRREPTTFTRMELIHTAIEKIKEFIRLAQDPYCESWDYFTTENAINQLTLDLARLDILLYEEANLLYNIAYEMLVKVCCMDTEE